MIDKRALAARVRDAAETVRELNRAAEFPAEYAWAPEGLEFRADMLEGAALAEDEEKGLNALAEDLYDSGWRKVRLDQVGRLIDKGWRKVAE